MKRFLLGVLIFLSLTSQGQNANYTPLNGPYGGAIQDYVSTTGAIVGFIFGQGILRSTDNGQTWVASNTGITDTYLYDLEKDPVSGKLYALSYTKLFASTDNGLTWVTVASSGFAQAYQMKKAPNGNLYIVQQAVNPKKVYRSTNSGTTWTQVSSISTSSVVNDFEVGSNNYLYVSTDGGGIYRSTNSGANWTQISTATGLTDLFIRSMTINGTDIYALGATQPFKSTDAGVTWTSVKGNISGTCFSGLIESGAGSVFIFNDCANKIYSSSNGGTSWVTTLTHPNTTFNGAYQGGFQGAMVVSATEIYASLYSGPFKSIDGGLNWFQAAEGVTGLYGYDLHMTAGGSLLYASANYQAGFHYSADGGQFWDYKYSAGANRTIYGFMNGSGTTSGTIFAYGSGLAKSVDDGDSWTEVTPGNNFRSLVSNDGNTFYASDGGLNLLKSTNAGVTWTTQSITGFPALFYMNSKKMYIDAGGSLYFYLYNQSVNKAQVYKVNAATLVATQITTLPTTLFDFDVNNGKLYAATTASTFLVSIDAGATWTSKSAPTSYGTLHVIDANTIFVLNENVYVSTDAGTSWVNTGNFSNNRNTTDVVLATDNYSYVAVDFAVVQKSANQIVPPAAPTGLQVTGFNHSRIGLFWTDNSNNEEYFIIERSKDNNLSYDSVGSVLTNSYPTNGEFFINVPLSNLTTYFYRVRAASAAGKSAYSNEVSATTLANCTASSTLPSNRSWTATTLNESGVGVKTDPLVTITSAGSPGFFSIDKFTAGASIAAPYSHAESTVNFSENCGSVFIYLVGSLDRSNGNGTWNAGTNTLTIKWTTRPQTTVQRSETTVFTLNPTFPAPTASTSPTSYVNTATSVALSWTAGSYVQEYIIKRSLTTATGFVEIARVQHPAVSYTDINLTTGTKYYYTITSANPANPTGTGATSSETSVTVSVPFFESLQIAPTAVETTLSYGTTWADLDGDSFEDLILSFTTADTPLKCFRNKGDGTFELFNFTNLSANLTSSHGGGVVAGDYNNDGKVDLFVAANFPNASKLWTNKGGGVFQSTDIFLSAGTVYTPSFVDFNNDGRLDISFSDFITNGTTPKLFYIFQQNTDQSFSRYDVGVIGTDKGISISSSWADYDNDNDMDLLVEEYDETRVNRLYRNDGLDASNNFQGFTKQTITAFDTDITMYSESSSWGDFDNDGDLDVFQGNTGPGASLNDMLYQNNGDGTFTRLPSSLPSEILSSGVYTNGSAWGDVDNDGDLDLLVARSPQSTLYLNTNGTSTFVKYTGVEYINSGNTYDNSVAFADYNKDGFLDVYVQRSKLQPITISKNTKTTGRWLEVKLVGTVSNKTGIGARVTINLPSSKKQIREIAGNTGFTTQSSSILHFGLGSTTTVPSLVVRWPSGITQTLTNVASNQLLTITEDNTGPVVSTVVPADASTSIAISSTLDVTFDEAPVAVATKKITVTPILPAGTAFTINATAGVISGNKVTFTPTAFDIYTKYSVTIEAGAFTDSYGNPMNAFTTGWTFTTLDNIAPGFTNTTFTTPLAKGFGSTLINATVTDNVAVTSVVMSYRGANSTGTFATLSGVLNGGKWDFTVPETFYNATGLEFFFTAKDAENNATLEPTTGVKQSLFETTPPVFDISPLPSSPKDTITVVKVPGNRTISIKVTDSFGVKTVVMSYRSTKNATTYTDLPLPLNATNKYDFSVAEAAFNGDGLEYYFTASDETGNTTRSPAGTKTYKVWLDNKKPLVTFSNPPSSLPLPQAATAFVVNAKDWIGVTSMVMKYRKIAVKDFSTSTLSTKSGNNYTFDVPKDWFDEMGIEYYFEAADESGNVGVSPDITATDKYYRTYVELKDLSKVKLTFSGGNATAKGYQIFSIPLELQDQNIAINFGTELGTSKDNTLYRFLRYHETPTPGWDEYPGTLNLIKRGEGYFINITNAEKSSIELVNGQAPKNDQSNLFPLALKKGWNQIGNPYTTQIRWSEVIAHNNNPAGVAVAFTTYTGAGEYDKTGDGVIAPYKGGFVHTDNDITLTIPFFGNIGGRVEQIDSDLGKAKWEFPFTLTQSNTRYTLGMVGMNEGASVSKDRYDLPMLPRLGDYIEAVFNHPEHELKKFSEDVVPTQNEYTWEFDVASSLSGEATMNWNNTSFGDNNKEVYLMDMALQKVVNVREANLYRFDPKESSKFKIFFGEDLEKKIKPSRVSLSKIYPNPTNGITNISFAIPEQRSNAHVKLEMYDAMGKRMSTLVNGNLLPGFYNAEWDATHSSVADGLYICRLLVSSDKGEEVFSEKIVVKK